MIKRRLVFMLAFAVTAFATGPILYADRLDPAVSEDALRRLKTQLAIPYKLRPQHLQVIDAHMVGPTPDHIAGTAVWRTLFGIAVGTPRYAPSGSHYDLNVQTWLLVWIGFLSIEGLLATSIVWHVLRKQ